MGRVSNLFEHGEVKKTTREWVNEKEMVDEDVELAESQVI